MANGWQALGEALSGGLGRTAEERGYVTGMQGRLLTAKTEDALLEAKMNREKASAQELARAIDYTDLNAVRRNLGEIIAGGYGSDYASASQGVLRGQEFDLRALAADPETSALARTRALGAVQGTPYSDIKAVGSKAFVNLTEDEPTVQPLADALGTPIDLPSDVQTYQFFSKLSPQEQEQFLRVKRADQILQVGGVPYARTPTGGLTPLSSQEAEIGAIVSRELAKQRAGNQADAEETQRKNRDAYRAFQAAIHGVETSMANTQTDPITGRLPAITAAAQTAEGAVAVTAPLLKQLFRSAGEGTFTDKDQDLLLAMVPTRTDLPEARRAKIEMINQIVAAKLGVDPGAFGAAPTAPALGDALTSPSPQAQGGGDNIRMIGGKQYVLINGQWYENDGT